MPKVSVILTSYNHGAYIAEAVQSVLEQSFADFELLIFDDGSQDNSRSIIESFTDNRIKKFLSEENRGPLEVAREALKEAVGEYVAVHHSDDVWEKDKLARQVKFLDEHQEYAACFTWVNFINEDGSIYEPEPGSLYYKIFEQDNRTRAEWLSQLFWHGNVFCHPSALVRTELYQRYRLAEFSGLLQVPDLFIWIRLLLHENVYVLPDKLIKFRLRQREQKNTSGDRVDTVLRSHWEMYCIGCLYAEITDKAFFLEVFPEAQKYVINGDINIKFALAKILEQTGRPAYLFLAMKILYGLLNGSEGAQIKKLYNYTEKDFINETGNYDAFNLKHTFRFLRSNVFIDYDGTGYSERVTDENVYTRYDGNFYTKFIMPDNGKSIFKLRYDPDETSYIKIRLDNISIDGVNVTFKPLNAYKQENGFDVFYTTDPRYDIKFSGVCHEVIVSGKVDLQAELNYDAERYHDRQQAAIESKTQEIEKLGNENEKLSRENDRLNLVLQTIYESRGWRFLQKYYQIRDSLLGRQAGGRAFKTKVLYNLKKLYRAVPLGGKTKSRLADMFFKTFAFAIKDTYIYQTWYTRKYGIAGSAYVNVVTEQQRFQGKQTKQPGTIAIQLHLYYTDLTDEFCRYLSNMPFKFDLFVSIVDKDKQADTEKKFGKIENLQKCVVRVVENRGRDVAPFVAEFGELLSEYDFIAHIHSKKSLYAEGNQANWRNYLLDNLLGSADVIETIFAAFIQNPNLGMIYPKPPSSIPYMAFTWLQNRTVGQYLLSRLGVADSPTEYFDFPAGTMFWARSVAIKRLLTAGLKTSDFPPEDKQIDGTLAHAVERSLALLVRNEGMDFYESDLSAGNYTVNWGQKNMYIYFGRSFQDLSFIKRYEYVSFDVFDTLIMRRIAFPRFVNKLLSYKIKKQLRLEIDFEKLRLEAEQQARANMSEEQDCSTLEIYERFKNITGLDEKICREICRLEMETEEELSLPRTDMKKWYRELLADGYKILLISDMYMTEGELTQLLNKSGYDGYDKLFLSSVTGMRKDTGAVWDYLLQQKIANRLIHIGDNEISDWAVPVDKRIESYHILSAANLFTHTTFGYRILSKYGGNMSLWAAIVLGEVLAKKFNSPFALHESKGRYTVKNYYDLGFMIYGPILFTYIMWLIGQTRKHDIDYILFLARDGYFLQPLYEKVTAELRVRTVPGTYFLASRRAVTMACYVNEADILTTLSTRYEGSSVDFFRNRFNIEIADDDDVEVVLPDNAEILKKLIKKYAPKILAQSKRERDAYLAYIDGLKLDLSRNIAVVDMGYAGTIQWYLTKLLQKNFRGFYFATNIDSKFKDDEHGSISGCFGEKLVYGSGESDIFEYQLLLESILTSPDGQLDYFEKNGENVQPVYGRKGGAQQHIEDLRRVHKGIGDYCTEIAAAYGDILLDIPPDIDFVGNWLKEFVMCDKMLADDLKAIYSIDDTFCNTTKQNVLDFYRYGDSEDDRL